MKLFVWDFHGVLEKGNDDAVLEISNQVLEEFGYQEKFSKKETDELSGLPWHQYFNYLLPQETLSFKKDVLKSLTTLTL